MSAGDRPLRALILSLEYSPRLSGGMGTHVLELSQGLARAGHHATVLAYAPGRPRVIRRPGESIHLIAQSTLSEGGAARPSIVQGILGFNRDLVRAARRLIAERGEAPDILHYHNWGTFPAASELARELSRPVVGTIHFIAHPIESWWGQPSDPEIVDQEKRMFREARSLIAVSRSIRSIVGSTFDLDPALFSVVHNGLDPEPFRSPVAADDEIAALRGVVAPAGEKIVLFAGRLNLQKGVAALLESAARVIQEYPDVRYLIAGEPDSRGFGQQLDRQLERTPELREKVELLGKVPRHQLATLYQVADLAVVPSIYEPFGYAAVEAMAAAVPIVASDVGGLAEIVEHGRSGLLVPVQRPASGPHEVDREALAASQLRLLRDAALATELGGNGQRRVLEEFSLERMIEGTVSAYRKALIKVSSEVA